jgi:hypothetical protein
MSGNPMVSSPNGIGVFAPVEGITGQVFCREFYLDKLQYENLKDRK